jgi:hypothetical protein
MDDGMFFLKSWKDGMCYEYDALGNLNADEWEFQKIWNMVQECWITFVHSALSPLQSQVRRLEVCHIQLGQQDLQAQRII